MRPSVSQTADMLALAEKHELAVQIASYIINIGSPGSVRFKAKAAYEITHFILIASLEDLQILRSSVYVGLIRVGRQ